MDGESKKFKLRSLRAWSGHDRVFFVQRFDSQRVHRFQGAPRGFDVARFAVSSHRAAKRRQTGLSLPILGEAGEGGFAENGGTCAPVLPIFNARRFGNLVAVVARKFEQTRRIGPLQGVGDTSDLDESRHGRLVNGAANGEFTRQPLCCCVTLGGVTALRAQRSQGRLGLSFGIARREHFQQTRGVLLRPLRLAQHGPRHKSPENFARATRNRIARVIQTSALGQRHFFQALYADIRGEIARMPITAAARDDSLGQRLGINGRGHLQRQLPASGALADAQPRALHALGRQNRDFAGNLAQNKASIGAGFDRFTVFDFERQNQNSGHSLFLPVQHLPLETRGSEKRRCQGGQKQPQPNT